MRWLPERAILYLAIAQTLIWACVPYSFPALLLWWEQDLGWSRSQLTGAFTVSLLVSAIFAPVAGKLIDHSHGARMMGVTTVIAGLLIGLVSFVSQVWQFYALWVLIGIAISGCLYEPCFAILTKAREQSAKKNLCAGPAIAARSVQTFV